MVAFFLCVEVERLALDGVAKSSCFFLAPLMLIGIFQAAASSKSGVSPL
jgi:hypothetical protein